MVVVPAFACPGCAAAVVPETPLEMFNMALVCRKLYGIKYIGTGYLPNQAIAHINVAESPTSISSGVISIFIGLEVHIHSFAIPYRVSE